MVIGEAQRILTSQARSRANQAPKAGDLLVGAQCPTILLFLGRMIDE